MSSTLPNPNPIANSGVINYANASGNPVSFFSTTASTTINMAILSSTKQVNKTYADIGDILTYTIPIRNTGNVTASTVVFIDTLPNGTAFVVGSYKQDGILLSGTPNPPGTTLPNGIAPGSTSTITLQVQVVTLPTPNTLLNTSTATASYIINPTTTPNRVSNVSMQSTSVTTTINTATIPNFIKTVDKAYASVGDTLTYTIWYTNTGNTSASNITLIDTIPNNTSFVTNSVTIGGVSQPGATVAPPTGLQVGNVGAGATVSVTFEVVVLTIPTPNPIPNSGSSVYGYVVNPTTGTPTTVTIQTNTVTTQINTAIIGITKSASASSSIVGETLTYTMTLRNSGNTTASTIVMYDTIPNGTTFVADTVRVNGIQQLGISPQINGVNIPTLPVGGVATVTFDVLIHTVPIPNPTSNTAITTYSYIVDSSTPLSQTGASTSNTVTTFISTDANPFKQVNKANATLGDTILYTLRWENKGAVTQTNVTFFDTIPNGTTFQTQSLTLNGVQQLGATITLPNGFNAGTLAVGNVATVTFIVQITTVPVTNLITNEAWVVKTENGVTSGQFSNAVTTNLPRADLSGITKSVDKNYADCGDTLTYMIHIPNSGNTTATNVVFRDTIPNGTTLVVNSVYLNGIQQIGANPATGISVGTIGPGNASTISFSISIQC